jgi:type VI secretion system protein ImpK
VSPDPKDPFKDATRARPLPTPGGRPRSPESKSSPTMARPIVKPSADTPLPPDRPLRNANANAGLHEFLAGSENRLLNAAMPLIALIGRLRTTASMPNVAVAHQQAVKAAREFAAQLGVLGYPTDIQSHAHYALCAAVDQAVLSTPWGIQSQWASQPLGIMFHREAWSGERFFKVLKQAIADPARCVDLLELLYICLSLDFRGMYQVDPRGTSILFDLRNDLYRQILNVRGNPSEALSVKWEGEQDRRHRLLRYAPLWVVAAICATIVLGCFLFYAFGLHRAAQPLKDQFTHLGAVQPTYARATPPASQGALTLRQLLSPEAAAHLLTIEDTDKGTLVSLVADDLFRSGSATLNPRHLDLVHKVGDALNQVSGRVVVIGHTDDVPVRSLRFADNEELSRARAAAVQQLLAATLSEPARLNWMGLGSSAPRYLPPDSADNRARNRRVEILLQND